MFTKTLLKLHSFNSSLKVSIFISADYYYHIYKEKNGSHASILYLLCETARSFNYSTIKGFLLASLLASTYVCLWCMDWSLWKLKLASLQSECCHWNCST